MTTLFLFATMSQFVGAMLMRNRLNRLVLFLFLVTPFCAHKLLVGQSTASGSEESNLTYRSNVSEVRLVFFATDEHNHLVEALQKDDFVVVDDERVIRDFRSFSHSDLFKLDVIVVMDSSGSVLPRFQQEITEVVQLISRWPWNPGDQVSVLSFSGMEAHFVCTGNCRSSLTTDQVSSMPRGGATPLFDAVETAAKFLAQRRQPDTWPVVILFSDGEDTASNASFHKALKEILASEAQIYVVDVSSPGRPSNGNAILRRMADDSGGRYLRISEDASGIFNDVIDDLHSARVLTYVLPESGSEFHSIRILPTHNLKLRFRCRSGYYRPGSAH